jgi:hypothetical protein
MNLHVTNDSHGIFPKEIADRIKQSGNIENNKIVNLSKKSIIRHEIITYISISANAAKKYIDTIDTLDKIIFHPYNYNSYFFLKIALSKFPAVKVYWVCWSYELYNLPHNQHKLYDTFSRNYLKKRLLSKDLLKKEIYKSINHFYQLIGFKKNYKEELEASFPLIHYFCSMLPSDFTFFISMSSNKDIKHIPFGYLSLENMMPGLQDFKTEGNKIMIGHSSSPDGNHYEILQKLSAINADFPIFLPFAYGNKHYGNLIKEFAQRKFNKVEIQQQKVDAIHYYKKLTEIGWAIINVKVQQGLGNIMALIWLGAKVFLDENTSTYKDFLSWGIIVYSIQNDLNKYQLSNKLNHLQIQNNRNKIFERFKENEVSHYWESILY